MTGTAHFIPKHADLNDAAQRVRGRLASLEDQLIDVLADVAQAGEGGNQPQEKRADELKASIEKFEAWATALETKAKTDTSG